MKTLTTVTMLAAGLVLVAPALADDEGSSCSLRSLAGRWIFATEVGQLPARGDITAIGTMNIDSEGSLSGEFDVTVASEFFRADVTYSGSVTVDQDCTGILTFETSAGTMRRDSIAVVGHSEIWGMSQNPGNLWTYRVRRISRRPSEGRR